MNQATLLERLDAVPASAAFVYRSGVLPVVRRGAGELCAEAAREIVRLKADVNYWKEAHRVAISGGATMKDGLTKLRDELDLARHEIERLRAKAGE
jgi:hypothetical protein